jgi:hypothetical protein
VAYGVDMGTAMLHADNDPGGTTSWPAFIIRPVLVLVMAVEQVRVAGTMGWMDGHSLGSRLF